MTLIENSATIEVIILSISSWEAVKSQFGNLTDTDIFDIIADLIKDFQPVQIARINKHLYGLQSTQFSEKVSTQTF